MEGRRERGREREAGAARRMNRAAQWSGRPPRVPQIRILVPYWMNTQLLQYLVPVLGPFGKSKER